MRTMIGISTIGSHIPAKKESNRELLEKLSVDEEFITQKIGVLERARKEPSEKASDLCIKAFDQLVSKSGLDPETIECCVVVTQNPDYGLPHTSAIVHGILGLSEHCACFDISLGCSGYVYALSVVSSFMESNAMTKGVLFTADFYSDHLDQEDRNTILIFGDAATVTLLNDKPALTPVAYDFGSRGKGYQSLIKKEFITMNGRGVFNFSASMVPKSLDRLLAKADVSKHEVRRWYLHQGSKYIVDTIVKRVGMAADTVPFDMLHYGNTVSSSIPIILEKELSRLNPGDKVVLSGFGVGLSWASALFQRGEQ